MRSCGEGCFEGKAYTDFIKEAEGLKSTLRTAWTAEGRQESTAEHSWRLALFAGVLCREFPELDREKALMMCLVHDLGERYSGEISAGLRPDAEDKLNQERADVQRICRFLPEGGAGDEVAGLWEEYSRGITPEARFVKALDKAETIIQHSQGRNPAGFDYGFNLNYGTEYFDRDQRLETLRGLVDAETRKRMETEGKQNNGCAKDR